MESKGNKILIALLIAALSLGCGFAGGLLAQKFYYESRLKPISETENVPSDNADATNINNVSKEKQSELEKIEEDLSQQKEEAAEKNSTGEDITIGERIAEKVIPSVVSVTTVYEAYSSGMSVYDFFYYGGGGQRSYEASCVGSGFIVNSKGYIVTNSHVINDGDFKSITISLYDGTDAEGEVLFCDSTLDLAIVKIDKTSLKAVTLGDSDKIKIGSYAAAIGNPLGLTFERSMSQGIISGLNRTITVETGVTMDGLLQTDAAINSGNSGGPLLDSKGHVIGIASAKASNGESMGFAIPINIAKPIIEQVIETGAFDRVYLGITAIGIEEQTSVSSDALKEYYGSSEGIYVASITKGGGAEKAGLKDKDVILSIDGVKVGTMNKLYAQLISHKAGDVVSLEILRNSEKMTVKVELMTAAQLQPLS